jgi:hypothetical protein
MFIHHMSYYGYQKINIIYRKDITDNSLILTYLLFNNLEVKSNECLIWSIKHQTIPALSFLTYMQT